MTIQSQTEKMMVPPKKPTPFKKPLENRDFLLGNFTIADIALGTLMYRMRDVAADLAKTEPLRSWYDKLQTRPGYTKFVTTSYEELRAKD